MNQIEYQRSIIREEARERIIELSLQNARRPEQWRNQTQQTKDECQDCGECSCSK